MDNMRRGRAARTAAPAARTVNYRQLRHPIAPAQILSDDEIAGLHQGALQVLETLGLSILLPEARDILAGAVARFTDDLVFVGADIVTAALASGPRTIPLRAAYPARDRAYGSGALTFMAGGGCPYVSDR